MDTQSNLAVDEQALRLPQSAGWMVPHDCSICYWWTVFPWDVGSGLDREILQWPALRSGVAKNKTHVSFPRHTCHQFREMSHQQNIANMTRACFATYLSSYQGFSSIYIKYIYCPAQAVLDVAMWKVAGTLPSQLPRVGGMLRMWCIDHFATLLPSQSWKP